MRRGAHPAVAFLVFLFFTLSGSIGHAYPRFPPRPAWFPAGAEGHQQLPVLRDLVIDGLTMFGRSEVLRWLRLEFGSRLPATASELAQDLERRYRREGFVFAKVEASFEEVAGRLTITVAEGRIDEIAFDGVEPEIAKRLAGEFDIRPGDVFNARDVSRAVGRLLSHARGAFRSSREAPGGPVVTDRAEPGRRPDRSFDLITRNGRNVLVIYLEPRQGQFALTWGTKAREDWFSPVDGLAPALGFNAIAFDHRHFNHAYVSGYVSYKFGRERTGYALGFEKPMFVQPRLIVGAEVHDMTASDDFWRLSTLEQSLVALSFKRSYRDYYERRGYQLHAAVRFTPEHEVLAAFRDDRHETLSNGTDYSFFRDDESFRANPGVQPGRLRALVAAYTWDSRGLDTPSLARSYRHHQLDDLYGAPGGMEAGWRVQWTSEFAAPGAFGGDFDFRRHILHARRYMRVSPRQRVNARLVAGFANGTLPPQRRFGLGGIGSVHGYRFKEAVGERMLLVNAEYQLDLTAGGGVKGLVFLDAGRVSRPFDGSRDDWLKGVGLGLQVAAIRIDFGWRLNDIPDSVQVLVRLARPF
ncbi:MAG: BamA/TamA family outer membrane protein [Acidobacteria bacterium]|nr:BamA/TamA family outer membrane protein [Acidobacteriota bacterium]